MGELELELSFLAAGGLLALGLVAAHETAAVLADDHPLVVDALPDPQLVADSAAGAARAIRGLRHRMGNPRGGGASQERRERRHGEYASCHAA
jgi:hypothetical protein